MSEVLERTSSAWCFSTKAAPGVLHQLTGVIAKHNGDIRSVSIIEDLPTDTRIYFELDLPGPVDELVAECARSKWCAT